MKTLIHGNAYCIAMPLNKDGYGPVTVEDTVITKFCVWDQVCNEIAVCSQEEDAKAIAELINASTLFEKV